MKLGTDEELLNRYPQLDMSDIDKIRNFFESDLFFDCMEKLDYLDKNTDKTILETVTNIEGCKKLKDEILPIFMQSFWINLNFNNDDVHFSKELINIKKLGLLKTYNIFTKMSDSISVKIWDNHSITWAHIKTHKIEIERDIINTKHELLNNDCYIMKLNFSKVKQSINSPIYINTININNIQIAILFSLIWIPIILLFLSNYLGSIISNNLVWLYFLLLFTFNLFFYNFVIKNKFTSWNKQFDKKFTITCSNPYEIEKINLWNFFKIFLKFSKSLPVSRKVKYIYDNNSLYIKYDFLHKRDSFLYVSPENLVDDLIINYLEFKKLKSLSEIVI